MIIQLRILDGVKTPILIVPSATVTNIGGVKRLIDSALESVSIEERASSILSDADIKLLKLQTSWVLITKPVGSYFLELGVGK